MAILSHWRSVETAVIPERRKIGFLMEQEERTLSDNCAVLKVAEAESVMVVVIWHQARKQTTGHLKPEPRTATRSRGQCLRRCWSKRAARITQLV